MNILLLGRSSLVARRVVPALRAMPEVCWTLADLSRHDLLERTGELMARLNPDIVYISTANHLHYPLACMALEDRRHVVVDKPLTLSLAQTLHLAKMAKTRGLVLAEATVWSFHPKIALARRLFEEHGDEIRHISATFTFPRLPPDNFRHRPELGGGMLADLGPYAVSAARVFFDAPASDVRSFAEFVAGDTVESTFTTATSYDAGRTLMGHFGMGRPYMNRIVAMGEKTAVTIDRAFAALPAEPAPVLLTSEAGGREYEAPPADAFLEFFRAVLQAVETSEGSAFQDALLSDARALDSLTSASLPHGRDRRSSALRALA